MLSMIVVPAVGHLIDRSAVACLGGRWPFDGGCWLSPQGPRPTTTGSQPADAKMHAGDHDPCAYP